MKYSWPIGFSYFYRPINIILSADWSDYIKDLTCRLQYSFRDFPKCLATRCAWLLRGIRDSHGSRRDVHFHRERINSSRRVASCSP